VHIAEGILPAPWAVAWAVPAVVGVAAGLRSVRRRTDAQPDFKSLVALMGAAVFAISLMPIPVPVAGSVSHPAGTPMAAIVIGPLASVLIAAVALLMQALFFAHGGLTTLGANVMSEGIVGSFVGFGVFWAMRKSGRSIFWAGFAAGIIGDLAVYLTTAGELSLGLFPLSQAWARIWPLFLAFLPTQGPLAVLEGVVTGGVLRSLAELRPDVAGRLGLAPGEHARPAVKLGPGRAHLWWREARRPLRWGVVTVAGLVVVGLAWAAVWALARKTGGWVGLDAGVMERTAKGAGHPARRPFINTNVGDLLLFVFLGGALLAGGVIGWFVRALRVEAAPDAEVPDSAHAAALAVCALSAPETVPAGGWVRRHWWWVALAAVVGIAVVWGEFLSGWDLGPLRGEGVARLVDIVLHPSRQRVFSQRGGDAMLFVFMMSGLVIGCVAGWRLRGAGRGRLRLRLPHLHIHDVAGGDRVAWQERGLSRVDARVKLGAIAVLLVANLMAGWVFSLVVLVASLVLLLVVQRVRWFVVSVRLLPAVIVAGMLVLLRGFTIGGGRVLFELPFPWVGRVDFTLEGVVAGGRVGLIVLAGVSLMLVLGLTTPLPKLLAALRWYRVPALLIEIGLLMYRYLFLFAEEAARMRQAQRLRGPKVPWRRAMGGFSSLGAILLVRSFERSQRVYDAQRLRGGGK
jgi:cobalt/nickel transport system permease protein